MPISHAGELAALGTAVCWVATALTFEAAGHRIGSLRVNLLRMPLALLLLSLAAWVSRGQALPTDATAHAWSWLAISGLIGFTFGDLCLFRAFVVLGPRLSTLVMSLAPVFAAVLGWAVLGEVLGSLDLLGMALTLGGIGWAVLDRRRPRPPGPRAPAKADTTETGTTETGTMATGPREAREAAPPTAAPTVPPRADPTSVAARNPVGILLALGGAFGQGAGLVLSKLGMGAYPALPATQIRVLAGLAGYVLLFSLLRWWHRIPEALADRPAMGWTALGAFFGPFLGVTLSLIAVKYTETGVAASLMATTPVLIIPVVVLLGKERVGFGGVAGALLAVAGVAVLFLA